MSEHAERQDEELKHHGDALEGALQSGRKEPPSGTGDREPEADSKEKE